jgi:hypothetical protein
MDGEAQAPQPPLPVWKSPASHDGAFPLFSQARFRFTMRRTAAGLSTIKHP